MKKVSTELDDIYENAVKETTVEVDEDHPEVIESTTEIDTKVNIIPPKEEFVGISIGIAIGLCLALPKTNVDITKNAIKHLLVTDYKTVFTQLEELNKTVILDVDCAITAIVNVFATRLALREGCFNSILENALLGNSCTYNQYLLAAAKAVYPMVKNAITQGD